jgi:hypothetical protein
LIVSAKRSRLAPSPPRRLQTILFTFYYANYVFLWSVRTESDMLNLKVF